jgi:hypothetical protein
MQLISCCSRFLLVILGESVGPASHTILCMNLSSQVSCSLAGSGVDSSLATGVPPFWPGAASLGPGRAPPPASTAFLHTISLCITNLPQGFDWEEWFGGPDFPTGPVVSLSMFTHGVNNGQAIKSGAVWYRQSGNHSDWESSYVRMQKLDEYHGQASGVFGCDEHLAGRMPSRGTELCTVVESMFSYETLFEIQGDPIFAERAEKIGYNALPATITPDMWAHQYLQQANEMNAVTSDQHIWFSDGPNSTLFGLAPNYGCCTANFNQGWPKLVQHLVYAYSNGSGLVVAMYGPAHIQHTLPSGQPVTLDITTDYPFSQTVVVDVSTTGSLDISLRIPSWAKGASVQVNSDSPVPATPGTLHQVSVAGRTTVILKLPASLRVERRYNNSAAIHYGPLLFGLAMKENFKVLESYKFQSKDYQITTGTPWNYALRLSNDSQPEQDLKVFSSGLEIGVPPFSLRGAPIAISAAGRQLDSWQETLNAASPPPRSPIKTSAALQQLTLLPFGATELRIAEIPTTLS